MPLIFEALNANNYDRAFKLQLSCHAHPWSRKVFADCLSPPYFAEQAMAERQVIGFFVGLQVLDEVTLMDIGIHQDARGKGFGRELLTHFVHQAKQREASCIWLEVRESNQLATRLYETMGFEHIEVRKNYYPKGDGREHALIMKLAL